MEYEYGIGHYMYDLNSDNPEHGPHRLGMTLEEAQTWLDEWKEMGGRVEAFYLVRRPRGPWERFSSDSTDQSNSVSTDQSKIKRIKPQPKVTWVSGKDLFR